MKGVLCPHCGRAGITAREQRGATRSAPATCCYCGALSHALESTASAIGAACLVCLGLGAAAALSVSAWWPLCIALLLAVLFYRWAWRRVELWPIAPSDARAARRAWRLADLLWFFALFLP